VVFWVTAPYSDVVGYGRFEDPCCLHHYTVPQPRRPQLLSKSLWKSSLVRFEVFTAVKIQVEVFWVMTPYSVVSRGPLCLHLHPEDGGSKVLRNVDIRPQRYTASQPERPRFNPSKLIIININSKSNKTPPIPPWAAGWRETHSPRRLLIP
jgi:hypothetical protein